MYALNKQPKVRQVSHSEQILESLLREGVRGSALAFEPRAGETSLEVQKYFFPFFGGEGVVNDIAIPYTQYGFMKWITVRE